MEYISVLQAAEKWDLSDRRVRILCAENKIGGVIRKGRAYMIPANAEKPIDGRVLRSKKLQCEFALCYIELDRKKDEVAGYPPLTEVELQRLWDEFLIEFTHHSTAIEGNTLNLQEVSIILEGMTIDQKPLKEHLEVVGHRDAFLYVRSVASSSKVIGEENIKQIHSFVLMDRPKDKGVYRQVPARINLAHEPPQPNLVEQYMRELICSNEKNKKKMHTIERVSRFHLKFWGIHPFIDGNGRTGRLILNLDLMQNGYPPIDIKLSHRKKYYEAFDAYYSDGNAGKMIELIAGYVDDRLSQRLSI